MKIVAAQYKIEMHTDWLPYVQKIEHIVHVKQLGAELLLLPEYTEIEAVCGL